GGALPSIDELMARLRDKSQLQLQNAERDLCMVLNALAARLAATARKVSAMATKRAAQEAAGALPSPSKKTPGEEQRPQKRAKKQTGATTTAAAAAVEDGEAAAGAEEAKGGDAAAAEGEAAVPAFRYNASGKSAAELAEDGQRMLREVAEMLETSWAVGENGIEAAEGAAAAGEGEGAAAAAAGEGGDVEIQAADASIRAWRLVQAHTSQLLADLLTAQPELVTAARPAAPTAAAAAAATSTAAAATSTAAAATSTAAAATSTA
ncbi:hypothetical protein Agub_g15026, partial [Astrephomene gubernaculifera]